MHLSCTLSIVIMVENDQVKSSGTIAFRVGNHLRVFLKSRAMVCFVECSCPALGCGGHRGSVGSSFVKKLISCWALENVQEWVATLLYMTNWNERRQIIAACST